MNKIIIGLLILDIAINISNHFKIKKVMATQKDAADKLAAFSDQLAKAKTEILAKMQELQDAAANDDNVSEELQTAIDNLAAPIQQLDDIVPDAGGETTEV